MENSEISEIFDIMEIYLARYGYRIMEGDEGSLFIRSVTTGGHYEIKVIEIAP